MHSKEALSKLCTTFLTVSIDKKSKLVIYLYSRAAVIKYQTI